MILTTETIKEYHDNGQLAYIHTICTVSKETAEQYPNRRSCSKGGDDWIRIGKHAKYYKNGQLAWQLNYDDKGNLIKDKEPQYREDGTVIIY